jgi:hypothetical protein
MKVLKTKGPEYFEDLVSLVGQDEDAAMKAACKFTAVLYDPSEQEKKAHDNLNKLRIKLAKRKATSLAKLPPCEATFKQHTKRAMWQTKVWIFAHTIHLI